MAISFGTVYQGGRSTSSGGDIDLTVVATTVDSSLHAIIALVGARMQGYVDPTPIGVSFDGTALTLLSAFQRIFYTSGAGDEGELNLYYLRNPGALSGKNLVVNMANSSNNSSVAAIVFEARGVDSSSEANLFGTPASNGPANGTSASVDVGSAAGQVVIDLLGKVGGTGLTVGAGQTQLGTTQVTSWFDLSSSYEAGAATVTMSWSWTTSVSKGIAGVSLKPGVVSQVKKASGVDQASIKKFSGVTIATAKKISGVSNT
jgi:hypothetical protein